ncbi:MAG: hypothetical protein EOO73_19710 [Myxococcales bacterium]|nr:MAG: hypothetical protein EOO73_19710 [Myxococcales bacterium]
MRLRTIFCGVAIAASTAACGDHYEGGGRRREVPTDSSSGRAGLGDGTSTQGGSAGTAPANEGGEPGTGGFFPFAGTSSDGGTAG